MATPNAASLSREEPAPLPARRSDIEAARTIVKALDTW
jgi:hypothetical protein